MSTLFNLITHIACVIKTQSKYIRQPNENCPRCGFLSWLVVWPCLSSRTCLLFSLLFSSLLVFFVVPFLSVLITLPLGNEPIKVLRTVGLEAEASPSPMEAEASPSPIEPRTQRGGAEKNDDTSTFSRSPGFCSARQGRR